MIVKFQQQNLQMQNKFNTPERIPLNSINGEPSYSSRKYNQTNRLENSIDYKAKTFQLMESMTQLQIREKQSQRTIFYLQRQLQIIHKQLQQFLQQVGLCSLQQVKQQLAQKTQLLINTKDKRSHQKNSSGNNYEVLKQQKISAQYQKILKEYKGIITTQQQKMLKYQSKWKQKQMTLQNQISQHAKIIKILQEKMKVISSEYQNQRQLLFYFRSEKQRLNAQIKSERQRLNTQIKGLEQLNAQKQKQNLKIKAQISRMNNQNDLIKKKNDQQTKTNTKRLQQQNKQQKQDLQMIKTQFRQLLVQKQTLQEKYQKLKRKYKQQIQHFQLIQKQVQEKLIEVEKQIIFYKQQREIHQEEIKQLKFQITQLRQNSNKLDEQFSFGGYSNVETQTDDQEDNMNKNLTSSKHSSKHNQQYNQNMMNVQCYQISIKSLIQQNNRLKRTIVLLDRVKKGEPIPAEAQLQLKLLKGLSELSFKQNKQVSGNNNAKLNTINQIQQLTLEQDQKYDQFRQMKSPTFYSQGHMDINQINKQILKQIINEEDDHQIINFQNDQ